MDLAFSTSPVALSASMIFPLGGAQYLLCRRRQFNAVDRDYSVKQAIVSSDTDAKPANPSEF